MLMEKNQWKTVRSGGGKLCKQRRMNVKIMLKYMREI
jgi:hypothetical protein